jgi:hypothetical protein
MDLWRRLSKKVRHANIDALPADSDRVIETRKRKERNLNVRHLHAPRDLTKRVREIGSEQTLASGHSG